MLTMIKIEIKIIASFLFFFKSFLIHFYNDNDPVIKVYVVKYLWAGKKKMMFSIG